MVNFLGPRGTEGQLWGVRVNYRAFRKPCSSEAQLCILFVTNHSLSAGFGQAGGWGLGNKRSRKNEVQQLTLLENSSHFFHPLLTESLVPLKVILSFAFSHDVQAMDPVVLRLSFY